MTRNVENPFSLKDMVDICETTPPARYEFGGLVEQTMTTQNQNLTGESNLHNGNQGLRQREVTVLDLEEEWDKAGIEQAIHVTQAGVVFTYHYRGPRPPRS